jgi:hypothetical protein
MKLHLGPPLSTSLSPSSVSPLCHATATLPIMCYALPPLRCSGPSHMPPHHLPCRSPASRWLLLVPPRRPPSARAALHRRSLLQRLQRHPPTPGAPTRHSPALPPPSRPCFVSPLRSHVALLPPALQPRAPPA